MNNRPRECERDRLVAKRTGEREIDRLRRTRFGGCETERRFRDGDRRFLEGERRRRILLLRRDRDRLRREIDRFLEIERRRTEIVEIKY